MYEDCLINQSNVFTPLTNQMSLKQYMWTPLFISLPCIQTLNDSDGKEQAPPTCKVILPNSSLMYLFCKSTRSLKEGLSKLCENKEYSLPALDIYLGGQVCDITQVYLLKIVNDNRCIVSRHCSCSTSMQYITACL